MTHREQITALFKDLAIRHPLVAHTDTLAIPRFYELEWEEMLQGGTAVACVNWTVVLEEYIEEYRDNNGDYVSLFPHVAFLVGKHVPQGNKAAKAQTFLDARGIAHSFIGKLQEHDRLGCDADLPAGVSAPANVDINTLRIQPIRLPYFDHAFGVRASIKIRTDQEGHFSGDEVNWLPRT